MRSPQPVIPPLGVDPDDPLMQDAIKRAQESLDEFAALWSQYPQQCHAKVPFTTSSGEQEFLWGEVRDLTQRTIQLFLTTPPVTHTGKVDRNKHYLLAEVVDWTVVMPDGKIKGGFTMIAMFQLYRQEYGELPKELVGEESLYESQF